MIGNTLEITVTQADIDAANACQAWDPNYNSRTQCVLGQALRRLYPDAWICVGFHYARVGSGEDDHALYDGGRVMDEYVSEWVSGRKVEPISFTLKRCG